MYTQSKHRDRSGYCYPRPRRLTAIASTTAASWLPFDYVGWGKRCLQGYSQLSWARWQVDYEFPGRKIRCASLQKIIFCATVKELDLLLVCYAWVPPYDVWNTKLRRASLNSMEQLQISRSRKLRSTIVATTNHSFRRPPMLIYISIDIPLAHDPHHSDHCETYPTTPCTDASGSKGNDEEDGRWRWGQTNILYSTSLLFLNAAKPSGPDPGDWCKL